MSLVLPSIMVIGFCSCFCVSLFPCQSSRHLYPVFLFSLLQDVPEIQRLCASGVWQERRDGLASLEAVMKSERVLS